MGKAAGYHGGYERFDGQPKLTPEQERERQKSLLDMMLKVQKDMFADMRQREAERNSSPITNDEAIEELCSLAIRVSLIVRAECQVLAQRLKATRALREQGGEPS